MKRQFPSYVAVKAGGIQSNRHFPSVVAVEAGGIQRKVSVPFLRGVEGLDWFADSRRTQTLGARLPH